MVLTPFSALIENRSHRGDTVFFELTEDWLQGRTAFGGVSAALAVQAMRDVAGAERPLRGLQTSFVGPVPAGPLRVDVRVVREGKAMRQVEAALKVGEDTACLLVGSFGLARQSTIGTFAPPQPAAPAPEALRAMPYVEGVSPAFTQHVEFRWAAGDAPFAGGSARDMKVHLRLRDETIDHELLCVLLGDAAPPVAFGHFDRPTMGSSVTWALELLHCASAPSPDAWWRHDTGMVAFSAGYSHERAELWTPQGELAAFGYQIVAVFG
ncbi:thioesterase family protein [Niveibacterium umoris]|uniref:Acyl-CoA thioesterase n=1 Tax=Niveibacterium umoris TaxID=1193620 RepID=A0A840BTG3_9RHOO|nr:thioesterase family protein [Niveibacterium umoris]MBB4014689.1 acyl-CoA thioesterase [Niveibacterium umoris]